MHDADAFNKEGTHIFSFFLGFVCSIGFYALFYKTQPTRWRSLALVSAAVLSRPICLLWQDLYLGHGYNNTALLIGIAIFLDVFSLMACVLLGANRQRMFAAAAFVYSVISVAQIPVVYCIAAVVHPLINTPSLYETAAQFPHLYYSGLFMNNIIITLCCFLAARWLRGTQLKPPLKYALLFGLLFIVFALIVLLWWSDTVEIISISFLPAALLGTLFLGILLLIFYLYTRLIVHTVTIQTNEYAQYIQHLSKRELELIEAMLDGNDSYKKLAVALYISTNTVKTHLKHIYKITGVSSLAALGALFRGFTRVAISEQGYSKE